MNNTNRSAGTKTVEQIIVNGGNKLFGEVYIEGMKNAALPIVFATILTKDKCVLENIPSVSDVSLALKILEKMGASVKYIDDTTVEVNTKDLKYGDAPKELVSKMRASTYLLGSELGRFHEAHVGMSGGCNFGKRPIDLHIKGFEALGARLTTDIDDDDNVALVADDGLIGNNIYLDIASVGATVNIILASACAEGITIIDNAAREPHIVDLANFLNTCGANITGAGTSTIKIRGTKKLHGCTYTIIPDMIEAGTFMVAVAATGGKVTVNNIIPKHMETVSTKLYEMGATIEEGDDYITVIADKPMTGVTITTATYPGFPTDMHPQFAAALCFAEGNSVITEGIWENRFKYTDELRKLGANITVTSKTALIKGGNKMIGAKINSVDLRGGAAVLIGALASEGISEINDIDVIERGYYDIVGKLKKLGANIEKKVYILQEELL